MKRYYSIFLEKIFESPIPVPIAIETDLATSVILKDIQEWGAHVEMKN